MKSFPYRRTKQQHTQLDMKNVLPTSFTWPTLDEPAALMYAPNEMQIHTKARKRVKRPTLDTHVTCFPPDALQPFVLDTTPNHDAAIQMEGSPWRSCDKDVLMEPVELPLCSTPPEIHTSFAHAPSSDQPDFSTRLESLGTLRKVEPPAKRTKVPPTTSVKRTCPVDRHIGYTEQEWDARIESARAKYLTQGHWYHAWMLQWPSSLSDRFGIGWSKGLIPLWQQTVETHVQTLEQHFHVLTEHAREAWAQSVLASPVEKTSHMDNPWPDEHYSSEVGRGQDPHQEVFDPLPWTSWGQAFVDWPDDEQEQSFSSANTSIVQQAARWQSPRLPRMSSESLHVNGAVKSMASTSMGSPASWPTYANDSLVSQAKDGDGTPLG